MYGAAEDIPNTIELTAIDAARNIRRHYAIVTSVDLFGAIIVETHWGRIGARGQAKALSFKDRPSADRYIASTLRRRSTSATRIGVAYEQVEGGLAVADLRPLLLPAMPCTVQDRTPSFELLLTRRPTATPSPTVIRRNRHGLYLA